MTELQWLSFDEWIDVADHRLRGLLRGSPVLRHDVRSASWAFQSQLVSVHLFPSGKVMPRFLWHGDVLSGLRIGELAASPGFGLDRADAERFADRAQAFFSGERTFIRPLEIRKPA